MPEETSSGRLPEMDIPVSTTETKTLPLKRTVLQEASQHKENESA